MTINIKAINSDGVEELIIIGTALKNAKAELNENGERAKDPKLDEAIKIIDSIIDEGFKSL